MLVNSNIFLRGAIGTEPLMNADEKVPTGNTVERSISLGRATPCRGDHPQITQITQISF